MRFPPEHLSTAHPRRPHHGHHHPVPSDSDSPGDDNPLRDEYPRRSRGTFPSSEATLSSRYTAPYATDGRARDPGRRGPLCSPGDRPAAQARYRDGPSRPQALRRRSRSPSRPSLAAQSYHPRSGDHVRDRSRPSPIPLPRGRNLDTRGRYRDREAAGPPDLDIAPRYQTSGALIEGSFQPSPRLSAAALVGRERSRTSHPPESRSPRSRQESSSSKLDRDPYAARRRRYIHNSGVSSPLREDFPTRREQRRLKELGKVPQPSPPRGRSPTLRPEALVENPNLVPLGPRPSSHRDPSSSFYSAHRRPPSTPPRWLSPPLRGGRRPPLPESLSPGRRTPRFDGDRYDWLSLPPPRSPPRARRELFLSKKRNIRDRPPRRDGVPELASGANSVEVNMSGRGSFRGAYGGQYPSRGHYNQGSNDSRNFTHSPSHATSGSSFQASPPAQSPYPSSRGSWGGQQQLSSQK